MKHQPTNSVLIDINGTLHPLSKLILMSKHPQIKGWIKFPDFTYNKEIKHLVLDPNAHLCGDVFALLPIITPGQHGKQEPIVSSEYYLVEVTNSNSLQWTSLSNEEKETMVKRYPSFIQNEINNELTIGQIALRIISDVQLHF